MARTVQLQRINAVNRELVSGLEVSPEQRNWIWDNRRTLDYLHEWDAPDSETIPLAIFADGQPVGFAMYTHDRTAGECFIDRFMIDHREQGRGLGRMALAVLLGHLRRRDPAARIRIAVDHDNLVAQHLYAAAGFRQIGNLVKTPDALVMEFDPGE
jgi:diamine N-acetyltransferase